MYRLGEAGRFQLVNSFHCVGGDTFAFRFETFDCDKFFGFNLQRITEAIVSSEYNFQARIVLVRQQNKAIVLILSQIVLLAVGTFKAETFQIWIILLVCII